MKTRELKPHPHRTVLQPTRPPRAHSPAHPAHPKHTHLLEKLLNKPDEVYTPVFVLRWMKIQSQVPPVLQQFSLSLPLIHCSPSSLLLLPLSREATTAMPKKQKLDPADCPFIDHSASEFNRGQHGVHKGDYDEDSLDGFIVHEPKKPRKRLSGKQTRAKERKKRSKKKLKKRTIASESEDEFVVPDKKKRMTDLVAIANEEGQPEWDDPSLGRALAIKRHELDVEKGRKPARPPPLVRIDKAYVQQTIHNYNGPVIQTGAQVQHADTLAVSTGAMPRSMAPPLFPPVAQRPLPQLMAPPQLPPAAPRPLLSTRTMEPINEKLIFALQLEPGGSVDKKAIWISNYREAHRILASGKELKRGYNSINNELASWLQSQKKREQSSANKRELLRLLP